MKGPLFLVSQVDEITYRILRFCGKWCYLWEISLFHIEDSSVSFCFFCSFFLMIPGYYYHLLKIYDLSRRP